MKILALSFFIACSIKIAKAETDFAQILTEDDRSHVLKLINNVCEKSWGEGQYDIKFKSFACDENTAACRLRFKIQDRGFIPGKFNEKYASCVFKNIKNSDQIFEGDQLNDVFFKELDDCITSLIRD